MGENGAGKSTLIKAITGRPAARLRAICGSTAQPVHFATPARRPAARASARSTRRSTCCRTSRSPRTSRSAASRAGSALIDWRGMRARRARACSPTSGSTSTPPRSSARTRSPCSSWSRSRGPSRPTSRCSCSTSRPRASTSTRCAELFRVIRELKQRGVAILFVSHFLDQVYEICDRVTVLRDGELVGEYLTQRAAARSTSSRRCSGRSVRELAARPAAGARRRATASRSSARAASRVAPGIADADVDLVEGEVLGVAGLLGSGRTELARALTGVDRLEPASSASRAATRASPSPRQAISLGRRLLLGEPPHRGHHQPS